MGEQDGQSGGEPPARVWGRVKWFDPVKGYGFLTNDDSGADVLLHGNVLRKFGQSTVVEGARIEAMVLSTPRGWQAVEVLALHAPEGGLAPIADLADATPADMEGLPLLPARVKWFDKLKGFGFASLFAVPGDVFLHIEVVRRSGFADLSAGEAVALRVIDGKRGPMAASVIAWDSVPPRAPATGLAAATTAGGGDPHQPQMLMEPSS